MKREKAASNKEASVAEEKVSAEIPRIEIPLGRTTFRYMILLITFAILLYWGVNHTTALFALLNSAFSLVSPFLIGGCVAFVINTFLSTAERLWDMVFRKCKGSWKTKIKRPICLVLSTLFVFGIIFAVVFMIVPSLKVTIESFGAMLPQYMGNLNGWLDKISEWLANYNILLPRMELDFDKVMGMIDSLVNAYGDSVINTTVGITTSIVNVVVDFVLAVVFSLYLLAQKEKIGRQARKALYAVCKKERADKTVEFVSLVNQTFTKFLTGQLTEAVIIGLLCFIGMKIFRMPYAGVISVLVGFTALIPVFGAFFGTAVGAFLLLLVSPVKAFWFILFIIVLQQLEGNLIYPKVVGKSVGLPGIWVLAAVTIGGRAFGVLGMLFSVPVCSVAYCLFSEFVVKRLKEKKITVK